ncbi:CBF MAK21 family protein [Cryptosporidium andersoni]|uniref:CBF MAK21 family protein n=1 Tax=Cryptosporidium andersoni TaxID=117008 RepID=A0A1J4MLR7_9CRYT|nr:CBF MAK21 family protein [Cryptosporidium andersoni]
MNELSRGIARYGSRQKNSHKFRPPELHVSSLQCIQVNGCRNIVDIRKLVKRKWIKRLSEQVWYDNNTKDTIGKDVWLEFEYVMSGVSKKLLLNDLMEVGKALIDELRTIYRKTHSSDKDQSWLWNLADSPKTTLKDKVESCCAIIQQNVILGSFELEQLLNLAGQISHKSGFLKTLDTILTIILNKDIFPQTRELVSICNQKKVVNFLINISDNLKVSKESTTLKIPLFEFLQIYFEDYLKNWLAKFIQIIIRSVDDPLWTIRKKILVMIFHIAKNIKEQRITLIYTLIHKFGDKEDKIASFSTYLLGSMLQSRKGADLLYIIVNCLSDHICRSLETFSKILGSHSAISHQNNPVFREVYRLTLFASEIKLNRSYNFFALGNEYKFNKDQNLNWNLNNDLTPPIIVLRICLTTLKIIVAPKLSIKNKRNRTNIKKHELPSSNFSLSVGQPMYRLLRVALNGINRSLPYAESQIRILRNRSVSKGLSQNFNEIDTIFGDFENEYIPKLYYICHTIECASIRIVILGVMYRILKTLNILGDRYYRLFYSQLLYIPIYSAKNKKLLVALTWRVINEDCNCNGKRALSIIKRAFQVSIQNFDVSMVLSFLVILVNIILYSNLEDITSIHKKEKKEGSELLIDENNLDKSEVDNLKSSSLVFKSVITKTDFELLQEDEEEHFIDLLDSENDNFKETNKRSEQLIKTSKVKHNLAYCPIKREPLYSNAINSHFWELELMRSHFHPLIADIARKCLIICNDGLQINHENKVILQNISKTLMQLKFPKKSLATDSDNILPKIFEITSLPLFLQILSYNPVDINLLLMKDFKESNSNSMTQKNTRINEFKKWDNEIPMHLYFYKHFFQDPVVIQRSLLKEKNQLNDDYDDFQIEGDDDGGKKKSSYYDDEDQIIDSLIENMIGVDDDEVDEVDELDEIDDDEVDELDEIDDDEVDNQDFSLDDNGGFGVNGEISDETDSGHFLRGKIGDLKLNSTSVNKTDILPKSSNKKKRFPKPRDLQTYFIDAGEMEKYLS